MITPEEPLKGLTEEQRAILLNAMTAHPGLAVLALGQTDDTTRRTRHTSVPDPCRDPYGDYVVTVQVQIPRWEPEWADVNALANQLREDEIEAQEKAREAAIGGAEIIGNLLRGVTTLEDMPKPSKRPSEIIGELLRRDDDPQRGQP